MSARTFLWVIPKWTLPATDGAKVATERLLTNLVKEGAIIDVLCLGNEGEVVAIDQMLKKWNVRNVFYMARPKAQNKSQQILIYLKNLISNPLMPLTMASFSTKAVKDFVAKVLNTKNYDYLFLDGLHLAVPFINGGKFVRPKQVGEVIYRAHNIEQDIWRKAYQEKKNFFLKVFLIYQFYLVKKVELMIFKMVDLVVPISVEDCAWINKYSPYTKTHIALMGMNFSKPLPLPEKPSNHFLFLGRLDWPPNRDGLKWLLDEVWPAVDTTKAHLHIAGSGDRSWLKNYHDLTGVTIHGFVDDVDELYAITHASLIPIFYGSGTRIKVIESYTKGRVTLSTKMGAQGANLVENVDYIHAETKEEWVAAINNLEVTKISCLVESARHKLVNQFDELKVAKDLYSKLK